MPRVERRRDGCCYHDVPLSMQCVECKEERWQQDHGHAFLPAGHPHGGTPCAHADCTRIRRAANEAGRAWQCRNCEHNQINHASDEPGCAVAGCPCPAFAPEADGGRA